MKILFIGDIFGDPGRKMVKTFVPRLRKHYNLDIVVANAENLAGGYGLTPSTYEEIMQSGVDICTGGNHTFDKKEGLELLSEEEFCLRPSNYPPMLAGKGTCVYTTSSGKKLGVLNLMGRTFMDPVDCPFRMAEGLRNELAKTCKVILLDFHAEASSEKNAMGWYMDGKVTAVVGTHTHVQTADERILPGGTAYITDAGMTGPYDSCIGMKKEIILEKFITKRGKKFEAGVNNPWLCGVLIEADESTGKALSIQRVRVEGDRSETHPPL